MNDTLLVGHDKFTSHGLVDNQRGQIDVEDDADGDGRAEEDDEDLGKNKERSRDPVTCAAPTYTSLSKVDVTYVHPSGRSPPPDQPRQLHFVIVGDPQPLRRHRVANNRSVCEFICICS